MICCFLSIKSNKSNKTKSLMNTAENCFFNFSCFTIIYINPYQIVYNLN